MKQDGFAKEDYTNPDTYASWGVAGCHTPNLMALVFRLTTLPCSTGEAERNWKEVKHNYTKDLGTAALNCARGRTPLLSLNTSLSTQNTDQHHRL